MIDPSRWIIVEAWLSLGLRLEWCSRYDADRVPKDDWMTDDDGTRYLYSGHGVWQVLDRSGSRFGAPPTRVPQISDDMMKHELAHWLVATVDEREKRNFGIDADDLAGGEDRAVAAEIVIDAMLVACARIATLALTGGTR